MRNRFIKYGKYLAAALLLAIVLEFIQISTQPGILRYAATDEIRTEETELIPAYGWGYEQTENGLITVGADPQMYYATEGLDPFRYVYFYFSGETPSSEQVQVFFNDGSGFSEANSARTVFSAGTLFAAVEIPEGSYKEIRADLDAEVIPLDRIAVGFAAPETTVLRSGMRISRILIMTAVLFLGIAFLETAGFRQHVSGRIRNVISVLRTDVRGSLLKALLFAGVTVAVTTGVILYLHLIQNRPVTGPTVVFSVLAGFFSACMLTFRKTLGEKPEYLFLILMLCLGFLLCAYIPDTGLNSWDEDVHYLEALKTSYVDEIHVSAQDWVTIARTVPASWDLNGGVQALHDQQDALAQKNLTAFQGSVNIKSVAECFNGLGLFAGRALGLRYYQIHFLGRFFGLMTYALLGFFAIRKLKSGKMIAAVAMLIPTEVFIACSYNYDIYLTGFTMLGLCYYIAQWQQGEKPVSAFDAFIMVSSITFGCLAKPVYIPLLWIIAALPKSRFRTPESHRRFLRAVALGTILIGLSYVIPMLMDIRGTVEGDTRGGSGINTVGQVKYILTHPLEYLQVVYRFLTEEYLNLNRLNQLMTNYAYHGLMPHEYVYLVLLFSAAFTDKNDEDRFMVHHVWAHAWPLMVSFGVTLLVMTSMYIVFTPVGETTINGAQFRYLIPMVFPVLIHIGSGQIRNRMNRTWYNLLILSVAASVNFACIYTGFISRYY